jgi:hypothetical protein
MESHVDLPVDPDLSRFLVAWTAQKNAFASGVEFREFHIVAGAFAALDSTSTFLARSRRTTPGGGSSNIDCRASTTA